MQPKIGKIAKDRAEADAELKAYCEKFGFDPEWLGKQRWETTLGIACNPDYGYEQALLALEKDRMELREGAACAGRRALVTADPLIDRIAADGRFKVSAVHGILHQMADAYVGGQRVNLGLSGEPFDPSAYEDLRKEWKVVGQVAGTIGGGLFTDFVGHRPEDKSALGKGNVGATLDARRYQGDLLARIHGVRFNMHVNLTALE